MFAVEQADDNVLFNNAHFVYVLRLAVEVATVVGAAQDATTYFTAAAAIGAATHSHFFNASSAKLSSLVLSDSSVPK